MKKMKKRSNGFTLTELAIVIAVIAILIAVLVPTFISLIDKAKKTSDTSLVTNVNKVMSINETPDNINEALEIAESGGYKVENLTTASSGTLILWDETSNKFIYANSELDSSGNFVEVDGSALTADKWTLWVITESYNSTYSAYSQYISGTISTDLPTVYAGISVGSNTNIDVSYSGSTKQEVTFITNGGTLTINNASATVNHYGTATKVVVTAVASNSYHVYGKVTGNIEVTKGRVVLESSSDASSIYVSTSTASDVVVVNNSSNDVEIAAADKSVASTVSTAATGSGSTTYIDSNVSTTTLSYFAGGFGTESSPYLIETADQFINIGMAVESNDSNFFNSMVYNSYYFKLIDDIDLNDATKSYSIGGYKTVTYYFQGELDGDYHTIYSYTDRSSYIAAWSINDTTFKNLNIYQQNGYALTVLSAANFVTGYSGNVVLENITVTGDKITNFGNNCSSFVNFVAGTTSLINCTNSVDIAVSSGYYFGIFVGGYALAGSSSNINNITFDTCVNTAKVTGSHIGFFIGNSNSTEFYTVNEADFSDRNSSKTTGAAAYITNCENTSTGDIESTLYCGIFSETSGSSVSAAYTTAAIAHQKLNETLTEDQFKNEGVMKVSNADLSVSVNDNTKQLEISRTVDGTLSITYCVSVSYYKEDGKTSAGSNYVWVTLDVTNNNTYYVTAIIDGTADGYTYNDGTNNISYSSLTNALTENTDSSTDSYGHSYKLVAVGDGSYVIVVGVIKLMSDEAKTYTINNGTNNDKVYYTVSLTQNNVEIGTLIGKVSELAD